jgi:hypothetical protein
MMRDKSAKDAMNEFVYIINSLETPFLRKDEVSWIRQQVLNRPEIYLLDEFPVDGPKLQPLN